MKSHNESSAASGATTQSGPQRVHYATPFTFSGEEHEEHGRIYRLASKEDCYAFRTFADSLDGFTLKHNKDNEVIVWEKEIKGEPTYVVKVFGVFPGTTTDVLYDMLQDAVFRGEWDTFRLEAFRIVKLNDNNDIGYYAGKSPVMMVANRDFVNQRMWHNAGRDEYVIFNTSVQHDATPPSYQKDVHKNKHGACVRAVSKLTGYLIRPWTDPATGERGSCLTYITQTDPNGWIPTTVTNYIATKFAPNTIKSVGDALLKFKVWFPQQIAAGTYEKDWDQESEWWISEAEEETHPVHNYTIEFAKEKWAAHGKSKRKDSKK